MDYVQAYELGREAVNSVSASVLATVLRELVTRYQQSRRAKVQITSVQVKCTENLEFRRRKTRKFGEDEGFESDEDARSTTSSCCLVEDHVFKGRKDSTSNDRASPSGNSISASTDSANSSGSSDTDEVEGPSILERTTSESFPISDVIFCHTEPRHPNIIAWVIKKKTSLFDTTARLGKTGVESILSNDNCLQVIVIKCRNSEDFKKLCDKYGELSSRFKLDQYKSINRRKPIVLSTLTNTKDVKVSLSDLKVTRSSLLKASELSILNPKIISSFKSDMKNSVSLNSLLKPEPFATETITKTREDAMKKSSSLSNLTSSRFNLLQRTDLDGMTHIEVAKPVNKSKIQKEIEGVILTDVDSSSTRRDFIRQRQSPSVVNDKLWKPDDSLENSTPPQRPERRKYIRKKPMAPKPPITQTFAPLPSLQDAKSKSKFYLPIQEEESTKKTLSSQYFRLKPWTEKEQTIGSWKPVNKESERLSRCDDRFGDRRRAKSVGRGSRKTPMAYRYIDITESPKQHSVFKAEDVHDGRRRRNSFDDMIQHKSSLKSVIKGNKGMHNKYAGPKKVTFSAFATVQVVD